MQKGVIFFIFNRICTEKSLRRTTQLWGVCNEAGNGSAGGVPGMVAGIRRSTASAIHAKAYALSADFAGPREDNGAKKMPPAWGAGGLHW